MIPGFDIEKKVKIIHPANQIPIVPSLLAITPWVVDCVQVVVSPCPKMIKT